MGSVLVIISGVLGVVGAVGWMFVWLKGANQSAGGADAKIQEERTLKSDLARKLNELYGEMVDVATAREKVKEVINAQESLKAERGRITITQAELETVESRLRELEEIERELEASGLETKEELNILEKKQKELASKNNQLKDQIATSTAQWDQLLKEVENNAIVAERVQMARAELISTEQRVLTLMMQIEEGNDQYFILKRRYDALDIEYAQLYEKFSEAESMINAGQKKEE